MQFLGFYALLNDLLYAFLIRWFGDGYITLIGGDQYEVVGGEMEGVAKENQAAIPSRWTSVFDGRSVSFDIYYIDGDYYFKLRDIASAADFAVDWDGTTNTVVIDTSGGYTAS